MRAAWLLVGCVLLAACVGGESPSPKASSEPQATVSASGGTGVISGVVTDPEVKPIAGASVQVGSREDPASPIVNVTTDETGTFKVTNLKAGKYLVMAARLGYGTAPARSVDVEDGKTAEVRFVLEPLPVIQAFHTSKTFRMHFTEIVCIVINQGGCTGIIGWTRTNVTFRHDVDEAKTGDLQSLIMELTWTPAVSQCPGAFRSDVYSPEQEGIDELSQSSAHQSSTNPYHWDNLPRVKNPTHLFIPREGTEDTAMMSPNRTELNDGEKIETSGKWTVITWPEAVGYLGTPVDFACIVDQNVDGWLSAFYVEPAPSREWSALKP